jgi:hypothetical protein
MNSSEWIESDDCMIDDSFENNYKYASNFQSVSYDMGETIFLDIKKRARYIIDASLDFSYLDICCVLENASDSVRSSFDMKTLILSAFLYLELYNKCELRHGTSFLVSFDSRKRSYMMELLLILNEFEMKDKYREVLVSIEDFRNSKMKDIYSGISIKK